ncbi:phage or prophage related protein [Streptomyces sp. NRRL F-6491]|nr:phage or prophage related protein [Streptomyces sp. NRRL F-6491]KOX37023.1 phage or prophage related protein [Streptomyces sp. NRRL F-6492]
MPDSPTLFERRSIDIARIRTIKPEAFSSESLAAVSLSAERTFFGLLTQADDQGRFRDQAAVIAGQLWPLRREHGPEAVEDDLIQLDGAGLICRYEGADGKRYLHIVTFAKHQKINRPSGVRTPPCPQHDLGIPREPSPQMRGALAETSGSRPGGLTEPSVTQPGGFTEPSVNGESAGQNQSREHSPQPHGELTEPSASPHRPDLGPRNRDLGSTPLGGASAPAPDSVSAKDLIGEYAAACPHRPPQGVLGHLGRKAKKLLDEGISPDHIRVGLTLHRDKGLHPSTLPSLVHEAMNATPATTAPHRPWTNPTDVSAYGGEL